jgi:cytochrome c biogenesis protein CcmG/thiol:disulfide interchange protein DsbE
MLTRLYMPVLASLGGAAVVALLLAGVLALGSNRTLDEEVRADAGPLAPQYTRVLPSLAGGPGRSISDYHGEVVLLNIWASWCPPCREEAPLLARAQRELAQHGGTVLGVSYNDAAGDSRSFMRDHHLAYPDLRDVTGSFAEAYGTHALPESFLLDRQGRVRALSRGEIGPAFVSRAVALAERG